MFVIQQIFIAPSIERVEIEFRNAEMKTWRIMKETPSLRRFII